MVSALAYGSKGPPGSSLGRDIALCSWARHFTLFTQVYKRVPADLMPGVILR